MSKAYFGELNPSAKAVAVIMAGGFGTRFWPMSRQDMPKQFLPLGVENNTLIQATLKRLEGIIDSDAILVVTAKKHQSLVEQQVPHKAVLVEPVQRNTAACLGYAAIKVLKSVGDVPLVCLPADHLVKNIPAIQSVYLDAIEYVQKNDVLVTIGIPPTCPETGYGYIQCADSGIKSAQKGDGKYPYAVEKFVEKPSLEVAQSYLASRRFFWNSGMFIWRPSSILNALKLYLPDLYQAMEEIGESFNKVDEEQRISEIFNRIKSVSVDVGIMEKADNVYMFRGEGFEWSDVGSWSSWYDCLAETFGDENGNILQGDALAVDCKNTAIVSQKKLIATVGLENIVVVETADAILVCHKDKAQNVKNIVEKLQKDKRENLL